MSTLSLNAILPDTIRTDRLFLRAPDMSDAPALHQLANNKALYEVLARLPHPFTREHAVDFITNLARTRHEHAYAIIDGSGQFIGVMGLHLAKTQFPELGYWLGQPFWGNGYATEAARGLLCAVQGGDISTIYARAITSNAGSISVLHKLGFVQTAEGIDNCGQHKGVCVTHFIWQGET